MELISEMLLKKMRKWELKATGAFYIEILIPTIMKLDLYPNMESLRADNFETMKENHTWRMSKLCPSNNNNIYCLTSK